MSKKIGCYGSVLYHDPAARRCSACPLLTDCKTEVAANKSELEAYFVAAQGEEGANQTTATKRIIRKIVREQTEPSKTTEGVKQPAQVKGIEKLPAKCRVLVQRWYDAEVDFSAAQRGENPFAATRNEFAKVAMDILFEGEITQGDMIDQLMARLNWKLDTAVSHMGQIRAMFPFLGIMDVTMKDGVPHFKLR